jgi:hypothetical protein
MVLSRNYGTNKGKRKYSSLNYGIIEEQQIFSFLNYEKNKKIQYLLLNCGTNKKKCICSSTMKRTKKNECIRSSTIDVFTLLVAAPCFIRCVCYVPILQSRCWKPWGLYLILYPIKVFAQKRRLTSIWRP